MTPSARALTPLLLLGLTAFAARAQEPTPPTRRGISDDPDELVRRRPPLVSAGTAKAIERGVAWLARNQARDGSFREGRGGYPIAMTALAGMAFLGHGDTPTRGRYAKSVRRIVRFLVHPRQARRSGLLAAGGGRSMYGHGFATMFLGCVLGETGDAALERRLKRVLKAAVGLIVRSQSKDGGWYYTPESRMDEGSVTVTQVQALRACQNAGIAVPKRAIERAIHYIKISQNADGGISYSARSRGRSQPAISAAACAVLYNAGIYDNPVAKRCLAYCRKRVGTSARGGFGHWFYAQLYLSQAYYQSARRADWSSYYPTVARELAGKQGTDGSWQGDGVGRVYGTSLAVTILALPYERVPLYMR